MATGLLKTRLEQELILLKQRFQAVVFREEGDWFLLPGYPGPAGVWNCDLPDVCFQVSTAYPGQKPYAFYVKKPFGLLTGTPPTSVADSNEPPFEGQWLKFSWDMPDWQATEDLASGYNLLNWALSFRARFEEGA